jgi:hypothetical protein
LADIVCQIYAGTIVDSQIRMPRGVVLPVPVEVGSDQTIRVRQGRPTCWLLSNTPIVEKTESTSHLYIFCLTLTRLGEPAPAPPAAAAGPQTTMLATIYEIEGDKEKLDQIDLGKDPPADAAKLQESLKQFGEVKEITRPGLLANWPCKSTITIDVRPLGITREDFISSPNPGKQAATLPRTQLDITFEGQWSDTNPQQGKVTIELEKRRQVEQKREPVTKDTMTTTAVIENNKPLCILGKVVSADRQDKASRYVVYLTARLR